MSQGKNIHEKRIARTETVIRARLRQIKQLYGNGQYYEQLLERRHSLAKRKPFDCGRSHCMICHPEKFLGRQKAKYRIPKDEYEEIL